MRIYFITILIGIVTMLLPGCDKKANPDPDPDPLSADARLLEMVNQHRAAGAVCGTEQRSAVPALKWSAALKAAALAHSADMNAKGFFGHTGSDGSNTGQRIAIQGYIASTYGENIAKGSFTEKAAIDGWMNSPDHCKNIMNGSFKEIGIARSGDYWTMVLAAR